MKALGYEVKIGIEIEFTVFRNENGVLEPVEMNADSNLHSLCNYIDDFDQIYDVMLKHGI